METNTKSYKILARPKSIALPTVKKEAMNENKSPLFKRLSQEDLISPNSNDIVKTWLFVQPEPNKRVQFARDDKNQTSQKIRTSSLVLDTIESLPDLDQHVPHLDLSLFHPIQSENKNENQVSKKHDTHLASITGAKFYRSASNRTLSVSSSIQTSAVPVQHSTLVPSLLPILRHRPSSPETSVSPRSISTIKDPPLTLSSLELNTSLSESDQKKFDDVRQHVPEEFEQLLPTLLKLGVVLWPKKLFENNQQLTMKERRQRQRLIIIIEKDQEDSHRQRHLKRLYGTVLPHDDVSRKQHFLKENLSLQGQLSLLAVYRDAIESELTKKILNWRSIPMRGLRTSLTDETSSINRSSIISNTFQAKQKFLQGISSRKSKADSNISQFTNEELFSLTLPDQIDNQWQRKSILKIIQQGMNILDQARKLSQIDVLHQDEDLDLNGHEIVRTFKRWLFLWSTLFTEDKYLH